MPPVPILLLGRELDIGGSERQLSEVARNLDPSRFEVHAGCFVEGGFRARELETHGIPVHHIPVRSLRGISAVHGASVLRRIIRRHRIRVVHPFDFPTTVFAVPVARAASVPAVIASQRCDRALVPQPYRLALKMADRCMHAVVVNCEFVRQRLIEDDRVPPSRIRLCYNGVDLARFHPAASERPPQLARAPLVIGTVAVLRPEKGLFVLLDAFAGLNRRCPETRLVVVGNGELSAALRAHAAQAGLGDAVLFEPASPDVTRWLNLFDIFVLPSFSEAFSNALLEAMACGRAVVASRVGGNPELVEHGKTGLLFASGDAADLGRCLDDLAQNPERRKCLGLAAADRARTKFSIQASAKRLGSIYTEILERRAS